MVANKISFTFKILAKMIKKVFTAVHEEAKLMEKVFAIAEEKNDDIWSYVSEVTGDILHEICGNPDDYNIEGVKILDGSRKMWDEWGY